MYHHSCPDQSDYRHHSGKYCGPVRANLGSDLPGTVTWCGQCLSPGHQTRLREIQTNAADHCLVGMDFKQEQYKIIQAERDRLAIARTDESNRATSIARVKIQFWWCGVVTASVARRQEQMVENEHFLGQKHREIRR